MKRGKQRFLSLILSVAMVLGMVVTPVHATSETETPEAAVTDSAADVQTAEDTTPAETENEAAPETTPEDEKTEAEAEEATNGDADVEAEASDTAEAAAEQKSAYTIDFSKFDFSEVDWKTLHLPQNASTFSLENSEDTEVNVEDDPALAAVAEELDDMKVLSEEEEKPVPLTEEQKAQVLQMYSEYQKVQKENADILGVQTPFFLQYNDKEDELGILGEMLVLANVSVDDVRAGRYKFDDLNGMIMNFMFGDQLGVAFYGDQVAAARDDALKAVAESGAKTEMQKILVLNDWLAHVDTFDMPYIMNADPEKGEQMTAPTPQKHEYYDAVYEVLYDTYESQLGAQFKGQIEAGLEAQVRQGTYEYVIREIKYTQTLGDKAEADATEEEIAAANEAADKFMADNKEAISVDAAGFAEKTFGAEVAEGIKTQADAAVQDARSNGMAGVIPDAPEQKVPWDTIVEQAMNSPVEDLGGMTPNDAIPVYSDQAAQGLTAGVLNYWEGAHFGALAGGTSVCLGYSKAFAYLMQFMHPEIYAVEGGDLTNAADWKTAEELYYDENGNIDITKNYLVDCVRITFDASVTMYGETQDNFNSDHFWNAVKVDGQWYYVDPCYTDVYTEVMMRDRVETDGNMNHVYFMFSHDSAASMYNGYYSEIKTLYEKAANSKEYEDSWFARAKSNVYSDGTYFYYAYDSQDLITMLDDFNNENNTSQNDTEYKLVRHAISDSDKGDGDKDFDTLIDFTYKADEDAESVVRVNEKGTMVENELLTKLYAQFEAEKEIYPSIAISTALYGGKLYFNLSNCIFSYDLESGAVVLVKEYNKVSATRDKTNPFGGMAFTVAEGGELSVENHPIASMTIKRDGKMYVSVATNYAFISGKDPYNLADKNSFGYEFEESNYNSGYRTFGMDDVDDSMLEQMGYKKEINDNDEFMWTANFVETLDVSHLAGSAHSYKEVAIDAFCDRNAYTENRCETCGASEPESRVEQDETALDQHHYIQFDETYYTKDKNGAWNKETSYVCTVCGFAINEPSEPKENGNFGQYGTSYEEQMEIYEKEKAIWDEAVETAGHTYAPTDAVWSEDSTSVTFKALKCSSVCEERKPFLDCLVDDEKISVTLDAAQTATAEITGYEGSCVDGASVVYTATGEVDGYKFTAVNKVAKEPGVHSYEGEFTWAEVENEDGTKTYTATVEKATCSVCEDVKENIEATVAADTENSTAPTCDEAGKTIYVATASVKDEEGNVIGTLTGTKEVEVPAAGHQFENSVCTVCGKLQFEDVKEDQWYTEPITWAAQNGIATGTTETTFEPGTICSRAHVVTFLWRIAGKPVVEDVELNFSDVKESSYYYDAVRWAVSEGITTGKSDTKFKPDDNCSRGEIVTFIWRMQGQPDPETTENPFADVKETDYFYDAILWASENEITSGVKEGEFAPFNNCTRSEAVTFLYREFAETTTE